MKQKYTELIPALLKASPKLAELYHIARLLEDQVELEEGLKSLLQSSTIHEEHLSPPVLIEEAIESEHDIQIMTSFEQFPKILKKQFLLPDKVFDQRLVQRDLLIKSPVKREKRQSWNSIFEEASRDTEQKRLKRQRTYILLDRSGSTATHERLNLIKAIALLHLSSHEKGKGEVYFRSFNQSVSPLTICKNDGELQDCIHDKILPLEPQGQTQLQQVLLTALKDIQYSPNDDQWEFLIISDGLTLIDPDLILSKSHRVKYHFVLVGDDHEQYSDKELRDVFKEGHQAYYQKLDHAHGQKEYQQIRDHLESLYQKEKSLIPQQLHSEHLEKLKKLCSESAGRWLSCPDLSEAHLSHDLKEKSLFEQLQDLYKILDDPNLSALQREHYLEQILLIQRQLKLMKEHGQSSNSTIDKMDEELQSFLDAHHELQDLILDHSLKIKYSSIGDQGTEKSIWGYLLKQLKNSIFKKLNF